MDGLSQEDEGDGRPCSKIEYKTAPDFASKQPNVIPQSGSIPHQHQTLHSPNTSIPFSIIHGIMPPFPSPILLPSIHPSIHSHPTFSLAPSPIPSHETNKADSHPQHKLSIYLAVKRAVPFKQYRVRYSCLTRTTWIDSIESIVKVGSDN